MSNESIDSRLLKVETGSVSAGVLTRSRRRAMVIVPVEPVSQQSTSRNPEITTNQVEVQEQGRTFAELSELSEEEDEDNDWGDLLESESDSSGAKSTTSAQVSASSASTIHSRVKRRRRSRDSQARSCSSRGLVQGTG